jgi:hypothetical protein
MSDASLVSDAIAGIKSRELGLFLGKDRRQVGRVADKLVERGYAARQDTGNGWAYFEAGTGYSDVSNPAVSGNVNIASVVGDAIGGASPQCHQVAIGHDDVIEGSFKICPSANRISGQTIHVDRNAPPENFAAKI